MSWQAEIAAERQYYSDWLREQRVAECEWHEGRPAWPNCPECEAAYEADQENRMDAEREERAFGDH